MTGYNKQLASAAELCTSLDKDLAEIESIFKEQQ
jgi:hypothetical protein